jgi:succinate dehydrogenase / fumarate reductase, cytochrome b subunit
MGRAERPLSPFMQYRWLYSNTLSILHRLTGILLSAGFLILVYWLVAAASGPERYAQALSSLTSWPLQLVLAGVLWSYCYHFLNGIRHLCWDLGLGFELRTARASGWTVAIASILLTFVLWFVLQGSFGGAA